MIDEEFRTAVHATYERAGSEAPPAQIDLLKLVADGLSRRRRRTSLMVASVAIGAVALAGFLVRPTAAGDPVAVVPAATPSAHASGSADDDTVSNVAQELMAEHGDQEGYAGVAIDPARAVATVHWMRPAPAEIQSLDHTLQQGVLILVSEGPISQEQVIQANARMDAAIAAGRVPRPAVFGMASDFQSFSIGLFPKDYREKSPAEWVTRFEEEVGIVVTIRQDLGAVIMEDFSVPGTG